MGRKRVHKERTSYSFPGIPFLLRAMSWLRVRHERTFAPVILSHCYIPVSATKEICVWERNKGKHNNMLSLHQKRLQCVWVSHRKRCDVQQETRSGGGGGQKRKSRNNGTRNKYTHTHSEEWSKNHDKERGKKEKKRDAAAIRVQMAWFDILGNRVLLLCTPWEWVVKHCLQAKGTETARNGKSKVQSVCAVCLYVCEWVSEGRNQKSGVEGLRGTTRREASLMKVQCGLVLEGSSRGTTVYSAHLLLLTSKDEKKSRKDVSLVLGDRRRRIRSSRPFASPLFQIYISIFHRLLLFLQQIHHIKYLLCRAYWTPGCTACVLRLFFFPPFSSFFDLQIECLSLSLSWSLFFTRNIQSGMFHVPNNTLCSDWLS